MSKKTVFVCEGCGYETLKWMGKCPRCAGWDTIKEFKVEKDESSPAPEKPTLLTDEDLRRSG